MHYTALHCIAIDSDIWVPIAAESDCDLGRNSKAQQQQQIPLQQPRAALASDWRLDWIPAQSDSRSAERADPVLAAQFARLNQLDPFLLLPSPLGAADGFAGSSFGETCAPDVVEGVDVARCQRQLCCRCCRARDADDDNKESINLLRRRRRRRIQDG